MVTDNNTANVRGTAGGEFLTFTLGHEDTVWIFSRCKRYAVMTL